jgi:hypothetical protein
MPKAQIIMAGVDLSAMNREQIKDFVIHLPEGHNDAMVQMAMRVDMALYQDELLADWDHTGVWEDGRELSYAELEAEQDAFNDEQVRIANSGASLSGELVQYNAGYDPLTG